jgi:carbon storage regulator CsrA
MLVLSRKVEEEITVNENIRIRIIAVKGGTVRIGIEAPADVPIDRAEIEAIKAGFRPRASRQLEAVCH